MNRLDKSTQVKTILIFVIVYYKNFVSVIYSYKLEFQSPSPIILAIFTKHTPHMVALESVNSCIRQDRGEDEPCDPNRSSFLLSAD